MPNPWDKPQTASVQGNPWDRPAAGGTVPPPPPAPEPPSLTSNPNREGVYQMTGPDGKQVGVPFSKVDPAQTAGYEIHPSDRDRFQKDFAAAGTPLEQIRDFANNTQPYTPSRFSPQHPATSAADVTEDVLRPAGNIVKAAARGIVSAPAGIARYVSEGVQGLAPSKLLHPLETAQQRVQDNASQSGTILQPGQAPPEPTADDYEHLATDTAGNIGAGMVIGETTGKIAKPLLKIPSAAKDLIRGDIEKPIPGMNVTPLQRYNQAKNLGVQLDVADATNSPLLGNVKRVGEHSLAGGHIYDAKKAANTGAMTSSMDDFLTDLYPGDRESGGATIQSALKKDQRGLQAQSDEGFENLPKDIPLPGLEKVGKRAQEMGDQNADYHNLFPSLKPTRAMSVVGDVGGLAPQPPGPVKLSPFVDESGAPIPSAEQPAPPPTQSFSTGQRLRSDLLEFGRKNPDIVAGGGDALVRELSGGVDDALAGGESKLTPAQKKTFRDANASWKDMKETYDDPSSPYYHAVRTGDPSTLSAGVGSKTPENARNLLKRLSPIEQPSPTPAVGALRRGTVESALKPTAADLPNYGNFPLQLNRIPADYRAELFNLAQNEKLRDFKNTANVLAKDFNPSGTAKQGQKWGEFASLAQAPGTSLAFGLTGHPLLAAGAVGGPLAYNAGQYALSKIMTSPGVADWMMKPSWRPNPILAPFAGAAGYESSKKKNEAR